MEESEGNAEGVRVCVCRELKKCVAILCPTSRDKIEGVDYELPTASSSAQSKPCFRQPSEYHR